MADREQFRSDHPVCIPLRRDDKELVNVDTMGSVVLPGRIFSDIVRKLPGDQVEWDVDERWKTTLHSDQPTLS